ADRPACSALSPGQQQACGGRTSVVVRPRTCKDHRRLNLRPLARSPATSYPRWTTAQHLRRLSMTGLARALRRMGRPAALLPALALVFTPLAAPAQQSPDTANLNGDLPEATIVVG